VLDGTIASPSPAPLGERWIWATITEVRMNQQARPEAQGAHTAGQQRDAREPHTRSGITG